MEINLEASTIKLLDRSKISINGSGEINNNNIVLTNSPHIEIELDGEKISRNWEALARYENKGFLIATDKYPKPNTILAYIPFK